MKQFQQATYAGLREDEKVYEYACKMIAISEKRLYSYSQLCEVSTRGKEGVQAENVRLIEKWAAK
jgi:hypothetical protein